MAPIEDQDRKRALCLAVLMPVVCSVILLVAPFVLIACNKGSVSSYLYEPRRTFEPSVKLSPAFWLGNADDPQPPADYLIGDPDRVQKWYWRNPFHNFTFYVMGIADQKFERVGLRPQANFNPDEGINFAVCRYGFPGLPFISYKNDKFQAYFGWRESGNFGVKLNF